MESSIVAPTMGPALFHRAQLRFKQLVAGAASNTVAARRDSAAESSATSDDGLSEPAEGTAYVPFRPQVAKSVLTIRNSLRDSLLDVEGEHLPSITVAGAPKPAPQRDFSPLPDCLRLHPNADRIRDDREALERSYATSTLDRLKQNVRQLQSAQKYLDQHFARVDQKLSDHLEDDQEYREAQCAREVAAAEERVTVAELKVSHERKKADAQRLEERIVAEVVPLSADGRAHGDVADIRRLAAPRSAYQMMADSSYPRF